MSSFRGLCWSRWGAMWHPHWVDHSSTRNPCPVAPLYWCWVGAEGRDGSGRLTALGVGSDGGVSRGCDKCCRPGKSRECGPALKPEEAHQRGFLGRENSELCLRGGVAISLVKEGSPGRKNWGGESSRQNMQEPDKGQWEGRDARPGAGKTDVQAGLTCWEKCWEPSLAWCPQSWAPAEHACEPVFGACVFMCVGVRGVESCCRKRQAKIQAVGWSRQPVNCAVLGDSQYRLTRGPRGQLSPQGHSSLSLPTFPQGGNYHRMLAVISNPYQAPSGTQPLLFLAEFSGIFPPRYHSVP